jgi:hypothetical protein
MELMRVALESWAVEAECDAQAREYKDVPLESIGVQA